MSDPKRCLHAKIWVLELKNKAGFQARCWLMRNWSAPYGLKEPPAKIRNYKYKKVVLRLIFWGEILL